MSQDSSAPRRRIVPATSIRTPDPLPHPQFNSDNIVALPSVERLISDALSVISSDIVRFKKKVSADRSLELGEARVLQGHIRALVELSREAREREKTKDLSNMSDEELLEAIKIITANKEKNVSK